MRFRFHIPQGNHGDLGTYDMFVLANLGDVLRETRLDGVSDLTVEGHYVEVEVDTVAFFLSWAKQQRKQFDPRMMTDIRMHALEPYIDIDEDDMPSTPRVGDVTEIYSVSIPTRSPDEIRTRLGELAEEWPGGITLRGVEDTESDALRVSVAISPRWAVERAVADSIRKKMPVTALELSRIEAERMDASTPVSAPTPAPAPIPDAFLHEGRSPVEVLEAFRASLEAEGISVVPMGRREHAGEIWLIGGYWAKLLAVDGVLRLESPANSQVVLVGEPNATLYHQYARLLEV